MTHCALYLTLYRTGVTYWETADGKLGYRAANGLTDNLRASMKLQLLVQAGDVGPGYQKVVWENDHDEAWLVLGNPKGPYVEQRLHRYASPAAARVAVPRACELSPGPTRQ